MNDPDKYSSHNHQEVIDPRPDVGQLQRANPGILERVVEGSLCNVCGFGVEQQEGDTQPLPRNTEIIRLKTVAQLAGHFVWFLWVSIDFSVFFISIKGLKHVVTTIM